ncbi:MAG: capsule assembly Wzi family protein [Spirosomataceae bacterium]
MNTFTKPYLFIIIFLICGLISRQGNSQVVFEPSYRTVNAYLYRLAQKGVIDLNDVVMPLSRTYIMTQLDFLAKHRNQLTPLEREELEFYQKDYTLEKNLSHLPSSDSALVSFLQKEENGRERFFTYQNSQFSFNLQPIIGLQLENAQNTTFNQRWIGAWAYGYLGKNISFSADFRNSQLNNIPTGYDFNKSFSPEPGRVGDVSEKKYDYSLINASITASWKWGSFTFGKNYLPVGYGTSGKLILSDKAPSFPHIRLDANPAKWVSFMYAHAWLNSNVIDSNTFHSTSVPSRLQYQYQAKYLAIHTLTLKPIKGLSLMLGESTIYNDRIQIAYLIPVALFTGLSHYLGEAGATSANSVTTNTISNSQMFVQLSSRNHIKNTHLYATFFNDEFEFNTLFGNSDVMNARNHTAYQLGASVADFPIRNLQLTLEYTRIRPFAYVHFVPGQTYKSNDFNMGHWLGPNASQLFAQAHYRVIRGLNLRFIYEYIRKGTEGSGLQQTSSQNIYPFLWGSVKEYSDFQARLQYELTHDLFITLNSKFENIKSEDKVRRMYNFSCGINYGF